MEDDLFVNEAHDETSQRRQSEWENTIAQDAYWLEEWNSPSFKLNIM